MNNRREQHEVKITKSLGEERRDELIDFISKHIADFKGKTEDRSEGRHGIPMMIFELKSDAQKFAKEISKKLDFPREHIEVKPRTERLELNRPDYIHREESP